MHRQRSLPQRSATTAANVAILIVGILFDFAGIINVPGAARLSDAVDGGATLTDLGAPFVLMVVLAWGTIFWRRSHPWIVLWAGAALCAVGVSYVLLLIGAVAVILKHPRRTTISSVVTAALVVLYALRESVSAWGGALPWFLTSRVEPLFELPWVYVPIS